MKPDNPSPSESWSAIMRSEQHGCILPIVLSAIREIPAEAFADAYNRIEHETTIGPMLNPTAYLSGSRFRNAKQYQAILAKLCELRKLLEENP